MINDKKSVSSFVVKFGYYALTILVGIALLYTFKLLFVPIITSILITLLVTPLVNILEARGINRLNVILGLYIVSTLLIALALLYIIPIIIEQGTTIAGNLPTYEEKFQIGLINLRDVIQQKMPNVILPDFYTIIKERLSGGGVNYSAMMAHMSGFFSLLSMIVIVPIVTFFFLTDGYLIRRAILSMVPNAYFEMSVLLLHRITEALKLFIRGQILDATAVGVLTAVGLAIIGLPYFLLVGLIAGVGNLIPYLGPIIGFIPAFFIVTMSPEGITIGSMVSLIVVFVLVQFIEGTFVYPIAVGKSVDLHPLIVIIGVTVGGQLGGILGMLVAIPIISIVKVSFEVLRTYLKSYSII